MINVKRTLVWLTIFFIAIAVYSAPYIGYLYPSGGQRGGVCRILVGGQGLKNINNVIVSGKGVKLLKITEVPNTPVVDRKFRAYMLNWFANIRNGKKEQPQPVVKPEIEERKFNPWWNHPFDLDELELCITERALIERRNALQSTPSLRQMIILDLEIAPDAKPGKRELRLYHSNSGVSNPKAFFVDDAPHVMDNIYIAPYRKNVEDPTISAFPIVLDGRIMPGSTDTFKFHAEKSQLIVFTVTARKLLPFIGDAVPGHFQPILRVVDSKNREVAFNDDFGNDPDSTLFFKAPHADDYKLEIRDSIYRGREDFVYRIYAGERRESLFSYRPPFKMNFKISADAAAKQTLYAGQCNVISGSLSKEKRAFECEVSAKKNQQVAIEVAAACIGSKLDSVVEIWDQNGVMLASNDDYQAEWNVGTILQNTDSYLLFTFPRDGVYKVVLRNRTGNFAGSRQNYYVLRISPPQPDFMVCSTRAQINLKRSSEGSITLRVCRKDGFDGEITIVVPAHLMQIIGGNKIKPNENTKTFRVRNLRDKKLAPTQIKILAVSENRGNVIAHNVIPCEEQNQAFAYDHLQIADTFYFSSINSGGGKKGKNKKKQAAAVESKKQAEPTNKQK